MVAGMKESEGATELSRVEQEGLFRPLVTPRDGQKNPRTIFTGPNQQGGGQREETEFRSNNNLPRPSHPATWARENIRKKMEQKKPRKTWTSVDRSKLSVHLLKENLAEDGCEEAQLDVAKKLLEESDDITASESAQRENAKKATYWLIKSAEQGNDEATDLLKQCLKTGQGITYQNVADVRSCIATPKNEKLVFKAAGRLYDKLSNGEEFITTTQILGYDPSSPKTTSAESADQHTTDDESLDKTFTVPNNEEDSQEEKAEPDGQQISATTTAQQEELDSTRKLMEHEGVKLTRADLLQIAKCYNNGDIPSISISGKLQASQDYYYTFSFFATICLLQLLLLSVFAKALTVHSVLLTLLSWTILLTSLKLLSWPKKLALFHEWTSAFQNVLQNNFTQDFSNETKLLYCQLQPVYVFSLTSLGLLSFLSAPPELSLILSVLSVWAIFKGSLNLRLQWKTLVMVTTTVGSCPELYSYYSQAMDYFEEQIINSELISLDQLRDINYLHFLKSMDFQVTVIIINLAILAESYFQTRKFMHLLEHFVFYLWFLKLVNSCTLLSQAGVLLCSLVVSVIVLAIYVLESRRVLWQTVLGIALVLCWLAVSGVAIVIWHNDSLQGVNKGPPVFWEEYKMNCHRKAWEVKTVPETRVDCWQLYESPPAFVSWTGKISVLKVLDIQRPPSIFLRGHNPSDEEGPVLDVFFDILVNVDSLTKEAEGSSWQNLLTGHTRDKEVMSIVSVLASTKDISGAAYKREALRRILDMRIGDIIQFQGYLVNGAGGLKPEVRVITLRCIDCVVRDDEEDELKLFSESTINVLLRPYEDYIGSHPIFVISEAEVMLRNCFRATKEFASDLLQFFSGSGEDEE